MLACLKKFFSRNREYPVETYGKLPCYQDYISVVITEGAVQWRTWLLETFQGKVMPPPGLWHFIYQHRQDADPVIGVLQASSDGLRPFPFSLFAVCRRGRGRNELCSQTIAVAIWQQLADRCQQLIGAGDIQTFYARFNNQRISPPLERPADSAAAQGFFCNGEGEWPQLLIAEQGDSRRLHLVKEGRTTNEEFSRNWQKFMATDQTTGTAEDDRTERIHSTEASPSGNDTSPGVF